MNWPLDVRDPAYEPMVLNAIVEGRFEHVFVPLTITVGNHTGVFNVSQDALKIEGVRINASAILQQHIADMLGAYLLTPKLLDQMWAQRGVTVLPCTQVFSASSATMIAHSACVDKQLAALTVPPAGIIQTVGKTWVITNGLLTHPGKACNDGWHLEKPQSGVPFDPAPSLPGAHMIQSPGYHHDARHADYSQICLFIARECEVDGQATDFATVAQDPELAALVSHEGVLRILRQPEASELVTPPVRPAANGSGTIAMVSAGASIGAAIAGPPGALVGGAAGWMLNAVKQRLTT